MDGFGCERLRRRHQGRLRHRALPVYEGTGRKLAPNYVAPPDGWTNGLNPVFGDANLHATLDNQNKLYNLSAITFCYGTASPVSGKVFKDSNGNGSFDTGEAGLPDWSVTLYNGATGTSGESSIRQAERVRRRLFVQSDERQRISRLRGPKADRWRQTTPTVSKNCYGPNELPAAISLSNLAVSGASNQNFGNVQIADIAGVGFTDADVSRTNSTGDTPYSGAAVRLYKPDGTPVASVNSAPSPVAPGDPDAGSYKFTAVDAGSYVVCVGSFSGYGETFPNNGNPLANPIIGPTAGSTACTSTWTGSPSTAAMA